MRSTIPWTCAWLPSASTTSVATLQELNPSLLRMTTPKDGSFSLALPAGTAEKFRQTIAAIPKDMRVWWRYHKVDRGETLAEVARQYRTTSTAIAQVNNLRDNDLEADSKLIIPVTPGRRTSSGEAEVAYSKRPTSYKVRKGDTVLSIADDFSVPAEKIRKWNHLHGNQVRAGRHPAHLSSPRRAGHSPENGFEQDA